MNELIRKFFQGELTEAEEQALSELLKNSEESAREFGNMAAQAYGRYGLPEPMRPGSHEAGSLRSKSWLKFVVFGTLAIAAILSGYFWRQSRTSINLSSSSPSSAPLSGQTGPNPGESLPTPVPTQGPRASSKKTLVSKPGLGPVPPLVEESSKGAFKVKILVRQPGFGSVTVQVVDSHNQKVRLLYDGMLNAGRWSFEWDGRLSTGRFADPGKYQIQVITGKTLQKHDVLIKLLKKS